MEQDEGIMEDEDHADARQIQQTILVFILRNFSPTQMQTFTLRFDQSKQGHVNYNFPESDWKMRVGTKTDYTFIKLTKLRPNEPWGDISFDFLIDDQNQEEKDCKFYRNWSHLRGPRIQMMAEQAAYAAEQQRQNMFNQNDVSGGYANMGANMYNGREGQDGSNISIPNFPNDFDPHDSAFMHNNNYGTYDMNDNSDAHFGGAAAAGDDNDVVACPMCTFHNPPGSTQCVICENRL